MSLKQPLLQLACAIATATCAYVPAAGAAESVSVKGFGAKCDGSTDDTAAIQSALDSVAASATPAQILLPGGTCVITAPLVVNRNDYLVGTGIGSIIQADYANWRSGNGAALDISSKAATKAGVFISMHRVFEGFAIEAAGSKSGLATTAVALHAANSIQMAEAVNYAFTGAFRDVSIRNFDVGMDIREMWNSVVDHVTMTGCRTGVMIHGKSVNLQFEHLMLTNFNNSSASTGFSVDSGFQYEGGKEGRPEGILLSNSLIFGAANDVAIVRVLKGDVVDNIIDGAVHAAIVVGTGDQVTFRNNYVFTSNPGMPAIQIVAAGAVTRGLNIVENHIVASGGPGVHFVKGGVPREAVSVDRNRIEGSARPILIQAGINRSGVRGNYGDRNSGPLISLEAGGRGVVIDGNNSADTAPPVVMTPDVRMSLPLGNNTSAQ